MKIIRKEKMGHNGSLTQRHDVVDGAREGFLRTLKTVTLLCKKELLAGAGWGFGLWHNLHSSGSFCSQKYPVKPFQSKDFHPWAPSYWAQKPFHPSVRYQHSWSEATRSGRRWWPGERRQLREEKERCILNSTLKYRPFQWESIIQNSLWKMHGVFVLGFVLFFPFSKRRATNAKKQL